MRSPGRCTNRETCWLGNGQRTVQIAIADSFCCPVCGSPLTPPPIEAITQRSINRAVATSLVLVLAAGGSGFGLVKILGAIGVGAPAVKTGLSAATPKHVKMPVQLAVAAPVRGPVAGPAPMPVKLAAQAPAQVAQLAVVPEQTPTPKPAPAQLAAKAGIVEFATRILAAPPPHILIATNVSQEPVRAAAQPISFGRPVPPEDDTPLRPQRWRYRRAVAVVRRTGFLPGPGWTDNNESAASSDDTGPIMAQTVAAVSDDDAVAATAAPDMAPDSAPDAAPEAAPGAAPETMAPGGVPDMAVAPVPAIAPSIVPAVSSKGLPVSWQIDGGRMPVLPESQPASRIDPAEAVQLDQAPDAPRRLATLPPARPEKLATPTYPLVEEAVARAGRVDVGCIITPHGLPDSCHVQHELGGTEFTESVLTWLKSGAVRYRPHVTHGQPVAEARDYRVRFEP